MLHGVWFNAVCQVGTVVLGILMLIQLGHQGCVERLAE